MQSSDASFRPGFRLSAVDRVVIVVGAVASVGLGQYAWWLGFVTAFVIAHFFLFCNIVRMARPLELVWSGAFIALIYGTVAHETPSWPIAMSVALLTTTAVVALEMRKPSYHGIFWQRINPRLPEWWAERSQRR